MSRGRVALVSDVLDRLLAEPGGADAARSVLFQAALQACAEESKRVKHGHEPVPIEALVERAREIVAAPRGAYRFPSPGLPPPAFEPEAAFPAPRQDDAADGPEPGPPSAWLSERFVADPPAAIPLAHRRRVSPVIVLAALGPVILALTVLYLVVRPRVETDGGEMSGAPQPPPAPTVSAAIPASNEATPAAPAIPTAPAPTTAPEGAAATPGAGHALVPLPTALPVRGAAGAEAESMVSPDWVGRAPAFVVHFSSYRERSKAQQDAVELARRYGMPAYSAEVVLPNGVWYRVVLGDFATAEAARAFRDALAAAHTPDLDGVYRITAP
jgi:hypothetical protein